MSSRIEIEKICEQCKSVFTARTTKTRFCSLKCASKAYKARIRGKKIAESIKKTTIERLQPIEAIQAKEILNVRDAAILLNCSKRTVYRLIDEGTLKAANLSERMTRIKKEDINQMWLNLRLKERIPKQRKEPEPITEFYTVSEVESIYKIKYGRLNEIIKRGKIPTTIYNGKLQIAKPHLDRYFKKIRPDVQNITEWYTVEELQSKYNLTRDQIYNRVSEKQIPKIREGKFVKISKIHFDNVYQLKI